MTGPQRHTLAEWRAIETDWVREQAALDGWSGDERRIAAEIEFRLGIATRMGLVIGEDRERTMSEQMAETRSGKNAKKPAGPRTWTEQLDVKMTEKELAELAPRIDSAIAEVEVLEEQKKSAALVWKSKIELAEERVRELRAFAASGKKKADVKVEERIDYRRNEATVVRLDTNETVRYRALTPDERQPALFDAPGEPLTATVGEVAGAKRGKRKGGVAALLDDVAAFAVDPITTLRCEKRWKGDQCTKPAGHKGTHGYRDDFPKA